MQLKSLLYSSKLEIITSKRFTSFLYFVFGISILIWWYKASYQFLRAYIELGEYDVTVGEFIATSLIFFLPFVATGAFMVANIIRRFRLHLWMKSQTTYADYITKLSPAEAGLLLDYEYSSEEVWATLLQLHFSGQIHMYINKDDILAIQKINPLPEYSYESVLLDNLLKGNRSEIAVRSVFDDKIIKAGQYSHEYLVASMASQGVVDLPKRVSDRLKWIIRVVLFLAGYTGLVMLYYYIFKNEIVMNILYPRYPVHPVQLVVDATIWVVAVSIIVSGFWPRFKKGHKNTPSAMNLKTVGYYQYLKSTYKTKFETENIQYLATSDVINIAPYMVAYKLVDLNEENIAQLIQFSE
jgi:hypothetical protein